MTVLEDLRRQKDWSQAELARRARLHPSDVSRFEGRRLVPYPSQLRKLARALGVERENAASLIEEVARA